MRKGGRPWARSFRAPTRLSPRLQCREWVLPGGRKLRMSPSTLGVVFVVSVAWTGKVVSQCVVSWSNWLDLGEHNRRSIAMGFFKKPTPTTSPVGLNGVGLVEEGLASGYPVLAQYLCCEEWEDGSPRETCSLIIFRQDGVYKVILSDKNTNMGLWASSKSFEGIPEALEARLTDPCPDWRKQRPRGKKG